jgi:hypothetical protein
LVVIKTHFWEERENSEFQEILLSLGIEIIEE